MRRRQPASSRAAAHGPPKVEREQNCLAALDLASGSKPYHSSVRPLFHSNRIFSGPAKKWLTSFYQLPTSDAGKLAVTSQRSVKRTVYMASVF
jgi:hypothetical protein